MSHDGSLLFTGDGRGYCRLWNGETGDEIWSVKGHSRKVTAACFVEGPNGPNGAARVLTASADNTVIMRDIKDGDDELFILEHRDAVTSMSLAPEADLLLRTSSEPTTTAQDETTTEMTRPRGSKTVVRLWNIEDGREIGPMPDRRGRIRSAALSPDGCHMALALTSGRIEIWSIRQIRQGQADQPEQSFPGDGEAIWSVAFAPDGQLLAASGADRTKILNLAADTPAVRCARHDAVAVVDISLPDGSELLTGGSDNAAKIWSRENQRVVHRLEVPNSGPIHDATFSPDGATVLIASDDGIARLWDAGTGGQLKEFRGHEERLHTAAFSRDGKHIVTASDDRTARVWNVDTGDTELDLTGHDQAVLCAAFSPDGKWIVTGGDDNIALVWDAATGSPRTFGRTGDDKRHPTRCEGHTAGVVAVAFSPSSRRIITAGKDGTARIWDAATGREILALKGHKRDLTSAGFSADGRNALTSSRDGTAIVWPTVDWLEDTRSAD